MAKFTFSAAQYEPWQGSDHDSLHQYVARLWSQYQLADEDLDLATACELAAYDLEVFEELQRWAWRQDLDALPDTAAAALGRALGRKPPRKGKGATARRDARLCAIAAGLAKVYGLLPTQTMAGGSSICAASLLATLNNTPSEGQIANILTAKENRG